MGGLRIGQLAERAAYTVKAIRFYEAKGLLAPPARSATGYRLYTEQDLNRLQFIRRAKLIGLSLAQIKELVVHLSENECACPTVRPHLERMVGEQLREIRVRLNQLSLLEEQLESLLAKVHRGGRMFPVELCACAGETSPARLLTISAKGGAR